MILLTGGSGLLGQELQKHIKCFAPTRSQGWDITKSWNDIFFIKNTLKKSKPKLIIHAAAYTDLISAETNRDECYKTNVIGTRNLASLGIPMLYISTEYVFDGLKGNYEEAHYPNPLNFYAITKLLGEHESRRTRSVVIRCLFKPRPFEHEHACGDQFTSGDYMDIIAREIAQAVKIFDKLPGTVHIGTGRKSTLDLARQTRAVGEIKVDDIRGVRLPRDTSLNTTLWERIKNEN